MDLIFHNTLTRRREIFRPIEPPLVKMYSCGPTVYAPAHIGNLRSYVFADLLRRTLKYNGYRVRQVINITDVDDKTIAQSQKRGIALAQLAGPLEKNFWTDLTKLNISLPEARPPATGAIRQIVTLTERLLAAGLAYRSSDGIYFKISRFPGYGRLANLKAVSLKPAERTRADSYDKDHPRDFALWKFYQPDDGEVFWDTPLGRGRPGWHIECSAMVLANLGETIDIHTGGQDLIFPHHTNEIAQSESATGQPLSRFWLHSGFVNVDGEKMSKSLGNIVTLVDLETGKIAPLAYRYWLLGAHYRTTVNFTWEAIRGAQTAWGRLRTAAAETDEEAEADPLLRQKFHLAVNDDLDTSQALAVAWEAAKSGLSAAVRRATLLDFERVLGLGLGQSPPPRPALPREVKILVEKREAARERRDWLEADRLRAEIRNAGFTVEDTAQGPRLSLSTD